MKTILPSFSLLDDTACSLMLWTEEKRALAFLLSHRGICVRAVFFWGFMILLPPTWEAENRLQDRNEHSQANPH